MSSPSVKDFLKLIAKTANAWSQQVAAVLKSKTTSQRSHKFATLIAFTNERLLRKERTEKVRQILSAFLAVEKYSAGSSSGTQ